MLGRYVLRKEPLDEKSCASEVSLSGLRQRKVGADKQSAVRGKMHCPRR